MTHVHHLSIMHPHRQITFAERNETILVEDVEELLKMMAKFSQEAFLGQSVGNFWKSTANKHILKTSAYFTD